VTLAVISCVRMANCPACWAAPSLSCGTGWDHWARYRQASRRGLIGDDELARARDLPVKADGTVIIWHADAHLI
jgi:hypothetical protein